MKKVLQHFFGKMTVLVSLLFVFACTVKAQTNKIIMSTGNCTITPNEIQMDIFVKNDYAALDLRWNGCVLRGNFPVAMLPSGTVSANYSFNYVGGSDFPLSFPAPGNNSAGSGFTPSSGLLTWASTPSAAYTNTGCPASTAPLISPGVTKKIGRFSLKLNTAATFVAGQNATFVWLVTSVSCNMYQACTATVTGYNNASGLRTLDPVCPLVVPSACAVTGSAAVTNPGCFGGTGSAIVTLSGAGSTGGGTYTVDGLPVGGIPFAGSPFTVSGLSATNHIIVATMTTGGCVSSNIAANVTAPPQLVASSTAGTISCFGGTTTVVVSATGGTPPYSGTGNFTAGAGPYSYTVTDANGCTSVTTGTITEPTQLVASSTAGTIACFGGTTTVVVSATGGTPPYSGTGSFTAGAGAYSYTVTDANGCTSVTSGNISQPAALTGSATATDVSCFGATDGTATITLSASTSGTYSLDGNPSVSYNSNPFTITGLSAGSHTVVATSAAGCVSNLIGFTVNAPAQLTGTGTTTPTTCGNPTSGTATITLSGSTSGTYTVDGGAPASYSSNPFTITGLTNGPHTIVATSAAGCVSSNIQVTVGSSAAFTATVVKTNISACNATNDGTITITPNGGQAPFTYVWSGGYPGFAPGNVSAVSNLPIGFYNVTVTSSGGCGTVTFTNIHIQYAYNVYVTNSGSNSSACGNTGSILLYGNAGITPYTYALVPGSSQPTPAPGAFQASNAFTGLAAGAYTAFVKDAGGCVSPKNVTVGAAAAIVVTTSTVGASSCAPDGSIQIFRTGGTPPYTYSINGTSYQTSNFFGGLASGPYTAYVKDAAGCTGQVNTTVAAGVGLTATTSKVNSSTCVNDGSIQVNASGGVPAYMYSLNGGVYQSSNAFPNLGAGNYTVQVKDSKGCLSPVYNVTINLNTIVVTASATAATTCTSNNGKIQLFRTGGYGPYTYSLDGNTYQTSTLFTGLPAGTYTGYVKDSKTCIGTVTGIVVGPTGCPPPPFAGNTNTNAKQSQVSVKTAALQVQAYPNPTESEFTLVLQGYNATEKVSITVTDLLGRRVYQTEGTGKLQYRFGTNFKAGMYNVQVVQGTEKAGVKLVKE